MIWISIASGYAGGVAFAVIGVPLTLWRLRTVLDEELELFLSAMRSTLGSSPSIAPPDPIGAEKRPSNYAYDAYGNFARREEYRGRGSPGDASYSIPLSSWPDL